MTFTEEHIDILTEILNIGIGKAANLLNEMMDAHIHIKAPALKILSFKQLMETERVPLFNSASLQEENQIQAIDNFNQNFKY
tara:strand:- start:211 stop:456 length:246 start_codon:yes stop_codon:yes gene_type:complete